MSLIIKISGLSKSFDGLCVLDSFSADISENTAIMGASGSGKTTLARLICSLEEKDAGGIEFSFDPKISVVFQEDRLFESFSAIENVCAILGGAFDKKSRESASEILSGLLISNDDQNKKVCDFSGGMRRRVAIARALAFDSDLLILDEPFKGLDENTRLACAECIKEYSQGRLVLLITHDRSECEMLGIKKVIEI